MHYDGGDYFPEKFYQPEADSEPVLEKNLLLSQEDDQSKQESKVE